jgi:hypothetical protein
MTIGLLKEYSVVGDVSYQVILDGNKVPNTICSTLQSAMEMYEQIKSHYTQKREEMLILEEI